MGLPGIAEARRYYRVAKQRFTDAEHLLRVGRTTGAVYLAGYTVECFLKASVLAAVAPNIRLQLLNEFRGNRAHNIEWLRTLYRRHSHAAIPREITRHVTRVAAWSTDLRYATGLIRSRDADEFVDSIIAFVRWVDLSGRVSRGISLKGLHDLPQQRIRPLHAKFHGHHNLPSVGANPHYRPGFRRSQPGGTGRGSVGGVG